jgi:hypothetical protein
MVPTRSAVIPAIARMDWPAAPLLHVTTATPAVFSSTSRSSV